MKRLLKFGIYGIAVILLQAMLSSCTLNEDGEIELTWLFWVVIAFLAIFLIVGAVGASNQKNEAQRRGISVDALIKEKEKALEKSQMTSGFEIEYLGGYPEWVKPCKVNFSIDGSNIVLRKGTDKLTITKDNIVSISNEKSGHRSVGRTAAGAVVGGVLTGGIGLIVGGALGARRKDTSEVFVTYKFNGVELTLNLKPGKNTDKVYSWINSVFAADHDKDSEPKPSTSARKITSPDSLVKGEKYDLGDLGICTYEGQFDGKFGFYPVKDINRKSPYFHDDVEPYYLIPESDLDAFK